MKTQISYMTRGYFFLIFTWHGGRKPKCTEHYYAQERTQEKQLQQSDIKDPWQPLLSPYPNTHPTTILCLQEREKKIENKRREKNQINYKKNTIRPPKSPNKQTTPSNPTTTTSKHPNPITWGGPHKWGHPRDWRRLVGDTTDLMHTSLFSVAELLRGGVVAAHFLKVLLVINLPKSFYFLPQGFLVGCIFSQNQTYQSHTPTS